MPSTHRATFLSLLVALFALCFSHPGEARGLERTEVRQVLSSGSSDAIALQRKRPSNRSAEKIDEKKKNEKRRERRREMTPPKPSNRAKVGALAFDFGFAMGLVSIAAHHGDPNRDSFIASAQQARNKLDPYVSFAAFEPVNAATRKKHRLDPKRTEAAREAYAQRVGLLGARFELSYRLGVQLGIAEALATKTLGITHPSMKMKRKISLVLTVATETDLHELEFDLPLLYNASTQCGSGSLDEKFTKEQSRNVYAQVKKARQSFRKTVAGSPSKFWVK